MTCNHPTLYTLSLIIKIIRLSEKSGMADSGKNMADCEPILEYL